MKRPSRHSSVDPLNSETDPLSRISSRKCGFDSMRFFGILVAVLMFSSIIISIPMIYEDPPSNGFWGFGAEARVLDIKTMKEILQPTDTQRQSRPLSGSKNDVFNSNEFHNYKLLGGLLAPGFDEETCLSRYQSALYRKESAKKPSPYLLSRLRSYEALHKRCGPYTESYNKSIQQIKSGPHSGTQDCNYVVWISFSGLGNRILTLASAFLYALLTNRVLLVDPGTDMVDLFCEPFPEVSWLIPEDFPLNTEFRGFDQKSHHCYGNMLKRNVSSSPPFIYLHLAHDYDAQDKLFFCDQDQTYFQTVPWLIMKTDNYFIPSLFLIPSFEQELMKLFPEKDTIFHFLGRYLFHPTNPVWGLVTRYHQAYLADADETIGIQIRVFDVGPGPFQHVLDQILACTTNEKLLPEITTRESIIANPLKTQKSKAVLTTSLSSGYFEKLRDLYWEHATVTGEVIRVSQPSHEGYQQTEKRSHNRKAWAEMYLLSLSDVLVTSSWSTFGYVAQGLGGLKPWILQKPENRTVPNPPCVRAMSMEPCFHAPPFFDCKTRTGVDTGELVPHVRHCEDMSWGLKLVDHHKEL